MMWFMGVYQWLTLPLLASFILLMIAILESKQERIMKGISLILFGIGMGIFLPELLIPSAKVAEKLPPDLVGNIQVFKNLAIFSCSGAGGSIIAGHAERFLSDVEKVNLNKSDVAAYNNEIKVLRYELEQIKRYFIYFSSVMLILLISIIMIVI